MATRHPSRQRDDGIDDPQPDPHDPIGTPDTQTDETPSEGLSWREGFRSMLDHPDHPLHHLKDA